MVEDPFTAILRKNRVFAYMVIWENVNRHLGKSPLILIGWEKYFASSTTLPLSVLFSKDASIDAQGNAKN